MGRRQGRGRTEQLSMMLEIWWAVKGGGRRQGWGERSKLRNRHNECGEGLGRGERLLHVCYGLGGECRTKAWWGVGGGWWSLQDSQVIAAREKGGGKEYVRLGVMSCCTAWNVTGAGGQGGQSFEVWCPRYGGKYEGRRGGRGGLGRGEGIAG